MKRLLVITAGVLASVVFASGLFFEWVLVDLLRDAHPATRLENAFVISLVFDLVLVIGAAVALTWPFFRRIRKLQMVAQRQRAGETHLRADFEGNDVLSDLARSFDALADANDQHLATQRELLHAISHELRTPLARLRFALAGLVAAKETHREPLRERAEADIDELQMLLDEVLAYVRAGPTSASRQFECFELDRVLHAVAKEHVHANIVVDVPPGLRMSGDSKLIRRAVSNLVRNAVHHAHNLVTVTVRDGDPVVLTVLDDGPGLPEEADDRLFLPFVRYDRRPGGHGLGSSIAYAVARRHGGDLNFVPRSPGCGAEFVLRLPRHSPSTQHRHSSPSCHQL